MHRFLLFISVFVFFPNRESMGQCPPLSRFLADLQRIDTLLPEQLQTAGEQWRITWQKCGFRPDTNYVNLTLKMGLSSLNSGDYEKAIHYSSEVIKLYTQQINTLKRSDLSKAYYRMGVGFHYLQNLEKTIKALTLAIKTSDNTIEGKTWEANAYLYLTYTYYAKGDYQKALQQAQTGESIAEHIHNSSLLSRILQQKAQVLNEEKRFSEAKNALEKAIDLLKDNPQQQKSVASQYRLLGLTYKSLGELEKGLLQLQKAFEIAKKEQYKPSDFATSLGFYYYETGNYPKSIHYYETALMINKSTFSKCVIYGNLGASYWKLKQFMKAFVYYEKGIIELIPISSSKLFNQNPSALSIQFIFQKEYLLTLIQDKADTWLDYYKATNIKSHLTNALKTYALADSMIDFMRYEHVGEGSKLFWRQKTRGMYERAIEASYLAGDAEAAFCFFEKSKAVLLSDKLNELGANQQLTESSAKRQRTLRDSIANLQNQLASLPANDAKRDGIQRRLEQFNDDFEAFRKQLESTNPAYYRYKYDNSTPTIAEFQKSISTNGSGARTVGFVSYFVGDSAIYAFCLGQKARLVRLSLHPSDYQSLANEFLLLCADRSRLNAHYPQYLALAHRLYQLLWKPLGMTASRVIISQDGVFLPFETLLVQSNRNDFLLKHHAISYTYSANFLAKNHTDLAPSLRQGDKLFHRSFVGFAPETFQPSLRQASLKGSVAALEAVEEKFWWGKTLKNNEATKAQFMRYAPNSRVIQLFTHADADSTEAVEPRIYFHDAALRLSELTQADRFAAQLLVLSACKTGVGQNQRGEGVFSLARGFAALGIPSTITTLWSVEDQPTYELTTLFYNYLDQGLPKDEALQRAKLDWLNQGDAADALPSQWAGMILVGDTAPLTMGSLRFIILGLGLLGLGVLGGVWWWRKHASFSSTTKMSRFYNHSKKG